MKSIGTICFIVTTLLGALYLALILNITHKQYKNIEELKQIIQQENIIK